MTNISNAQKLKYVMKGNYHELMAIYCRSHANPLPAIRGRLREDAVANFVSSWIPDRYRVQNRVFCTSIDDGMLNEEIDMVIHDSQEGVVWPLDANMQTAVATWEEVFLVSEIKSKLTKNELINAINKINIVREFSYNKGKFPPYCLLVAYEVDSKFEQEFYEYITDGWDCPFDAIIIITGRAYFATKHEFLRNSYCHGLSPAYGENDGKVHDRIILDGIRMSSIKDSYRCVGEGDVTAGLSALAYISCFATSGDSVTQSLMSAMGVVDYNPIFINDDNGQEDE